MFNVSEQGATQGRLDSFFKPLPGSGSAKRKVSDMALKVKDATGVEARFVFR